MKSLVGLFAFLFLAIYVSSASALFISSISSPTLTPGETGSLTVTLENDASDTIEDVTFSLDLSNLPITTVGSSEDSIDEIDDDDSDKFSFTLKASTNAKPNDYNVPYTITYKGSTLVKKGTIGVKITAPIALDFTSSIDNPVVGQKAKITLKMINKGQADARFVSLEIVPDGFTLLSEDRLYIGTISSDDFETATFDVLFTSQSPQLIGNLDYTDFDNNQKTTSVDLPLIVYSKERAIELGIIKKNNLFTYILVIAIILIFWMSVRSYKKRKRMRKSLESSNAGR